MSAGICFILAGIFKKNYFMKKLYTIFTICLLQFVICNFSFAQQWYPLKSGTSQTLNSIFFTDPDNAYVAGASGTILKTSDAGNSWAALPSGVSATLYSVFFPDANTGYVAGQAGIILKTTDAGSSWIVLASGTTVNLVSIYFTDTATGYVAGISGKILKTTDAGSTWVTLTSGTVNDLTKIFFSNPSNGYAVGSNNTIRQTTNAGNLWGAPTYIGGGNSNLYSITFKDDNNGFSVGMNGTILKTNNGGVYWDPVTSGVTDYLLDVYFSDPNTYYAVGTSGTIIKTSDDGVSWENLSTGTTDLLGIYFTDPNTGYAVGVNGTILKTCSVVANAGPDTTICSGIALTLGSSNTASGGTSPYIYAWSSGTSLNNPAIANPIATPGSYTVYNLTVTDSLGCTAFDTVTINALPSPVAAVQSVANVTCEGGNDGIASATANGGISPFTFNWSNGATSPNIGGLTTGFYIVTVTGGNGCTDTASVAIIATNTISVAPTSVFAGSDTICPGGSTTLNVSGGTLGTGASYAWYKGSCGGANPVGSGSSTSVTPATTTTYYARVEGTCNTTACDSITVVVNSYSVAPASVSASANPVCAGNSTTLNQVGGSLEAGADYFWYSGSCGGTLVGSGSSISVSPSSLTTYYVRAEGLCYTSACANYNLNVNPSPTVNASNNGPVCMGQALTLSSAGSGSFFYWSGPNGFTGSSQNPTVSTAVSAAMAGTYSVTLTDANGCSNFASTTVVVKANPTPVITPGGATTFCQGGSVTLDAGGPFSNYLWSNGATSATLLASSSGVFSVTVTDINGCSGSSVTTVVTVNPNPNATINSAGPFCSDDAAVNLTSASPGGTWSGTGIVNAGLGTFNPATAGTGTHTITYSVTVNGCTSTDTEAITVNANPDATINPVGDLCTGDSPITLTAATPGGSWGGTGITNSVTGIFDPAVSGPGVFSVAYNVSSGGCSFSDTILITVNFSVDPTIYSISPMCTGDAPVALTAATGGGAWSGTGVSGNIFDPAVAGSGTHVITYTIAGSCGGSDNETIIVNANPDATINPVADLCSGDAPFSLNAATGGGTWSGQGVSGNTFDPAVAGSGTFIIVYTVTSGGCTSSDSVSVVVNSGFDATINSISSMCSDDAPITLTAATAGGTWSGTGITDINNGIFNPSVAGSGVHTITYTIAGTCGGTDTENISVNQQSNATINPAGPFCTSDGPINLTSLQGGGIWSGNGITDVNNGIFNPAISGAGTWIITYSISGTCGDFDSISVTVSPCSFLISGTIYDQTHSFTLNNGTVYLFQYDTSQTQFTVFDSTDLSGSNGDYVLNNPTVGQYIVLFRPDNIIYPNAIPTYYGDTALWSGAMVIDLSGNTGGIDISTREFQQLTGSGNINGFIQFGIGTGKTGDGNVIPFGDPVPGIDVSVEQIPGGIVRHTTTDNGGFYSFSDLPLGNTYRLLVDIPGLPMDTTYTVNLSSSDTMINNLDYVVDTSSGSAGIYIGFPLGTSEYQFSSFNFCVYPNPFSQIINVEFVLTEKSRMSLDVYNLLGEKVYSESGKSLSSGKFHSGIKGEELGKSGIYFIQLYINGVMKRPVKIMLETADE